MSTEDRLRRFILDDLQFPGTADELTTDFPLIENGAIDSLGVHSITMFCEDELGIEIDDTDLLPENFATLGAIVTMVDNKLQS
jgi:acyl carrier protein